MMNAVRQRLRRFDRATGTWTRSAADHCINATVSTKSDPFVLDPFALRLLAASIKTARKADARSATATQHLSLITYHLTLIDDSRMEFTITIYRPTDKLQINANKTDARFVKDEEIIAFIINNPTLSMQEYANKLQIKYSVLRGRMSKLKAKGLRHEGSKKSGRWIFA